MSIGQDQTQMAMFPEIYQEVKEGERRRMDILILLQPTRLFRRCHVTLTQLCLETSSVCFECGTMFCFDKDKTSPIFSTGKIAFIFTWKIWKSIW